MLTFYAFLAEMAGYDLTQKYQHFNSLLFNSSLPHIPITWSRKLGGASGKTYAQGANLGFSVVPGTIRMEISEIFKGSDERLDGIMVHEMIHVHFFHIGDARENHGPNFMQMRSELNKKLSFEIPLSDKAAELEINDEIKGSLIGIILRDDHGRFSASFFGKAAWTQKKDRCIDLYTKKVQREPGIKYSFYFGKNNLHRKYGTNPATSFVFYLVTPSEVQVIQQMPLVHTIG